MAQLAVTTLVGSRELQRRRRDARRRIGRQILESRTESGIGRTELARAVGIDPSYLWKVETGNAQPSLDVLISIAAALGSELGVRLFSGSGPRIRDRFQAPMIEALVRRLAACWRATPEVPVRDARGVVDLVLEDARRRLRIASECHSELRRLEEVIRRASEKADGLAALHAGDTVSKLLLLRSTVRTREIARTYEATLRAAYPGRTADAVVALLGNGPWPGAAVVWARLDGGRVDILDGPPRGVRLGR
jgi:transcriptional regulator with XRE-family HTH domain